MFHKATAVIVHPNFTKFSALTLGYFIWFFSAHHQYITRSFTIPICFYQTQQRTVQAPQETTITIAGHRSDIYRLKAQELAIHIDASSYPDGDHEILINSSNLFLPDTLKLVELVPSMISFNIQSISKNNDPTIQPI